MARDWLNTLFLTSFKGVPFWTERDEEEGGRRIVKHQFPMRDLPFLEDLGEDTRDFELNAYLASDVADAEASALVAACAARGAGILVLPMQGPVLVKCLRFQRRRDKDRHGYVAFSLKFTREGAASALVSIASLANLVFVAADMAALSSAASFAASITTSLQPDYVVEAAVEPIQTSVAAIDAIRTSEPVDPEESGLIRNDVQALFDGAGDLIVSAPEDLAARTFAATRATGDAMPADAAARAFETVWIEGRVDARSVYPTVGARVAARNRSAGFLVMRLAALTAYCEAIVRMQLADRPAALTLRANVSEFFEAELEALSAEHSELFAAMVRLRDATIDYLSRAILDLAPVVSVTANLRMPSLYWAWRLYHEPSRATEIVARNRVAHPSFIPPSFEALAR